MKLVSLLAATVSVAIPVEVVHAQESDASNKLLVVLTPADLPSWFMFQTKDTVNGWIRDSDGKSITAHAWELWGAVTSITDQELNGQRVPVFETWWNREELFQATGGLNGLRRVSRLRILDKPHQFDDIVRPAQAGRPDDTLFSDNKYNNAMKVFVDAHRYSKDGKVLKQLNDGWAAGASVADRKIEDFPTDSVMLKPVFEIVSGKGPTILTYWTGPENSTSPATPSESTWTKKMVVVPPGTDTATVKILVDGAYLPVVESSAFYAYKISTPDEVAGFKRATGNPQFDVSIGDLAILTAMHISTREIDNWTWQTFWWSFEKPTIPSAVGHRVIAPYDHYQVSVGYSFVQNANDPNSLTLTCFNPYLETNFGNEAFGRPGQLGIESNCMSCHRVASWPKTLPQDRLARGESASIRYIANGIISPGDPTIFGKRTKTDFVWGFRNIEEPK